MDDFHVLGNTGRVLNEFSDILSINPDEVPNVGVTIPIPIFDSDTVIELANRARRNFKALEPLVKLSPPLYIVGDIHGNFFDLIRVLVLSGLPPSNRFLFLGDYVDRGQYSIECIVLLFALSIKFPQHIILLRGNHEFNRVNENYGFKNECEEQFGNLDAYKMINEAFDWMPIACCIGEDIFAVHGGISPQITSFRQLELIKRPLLTYDNNICSDLLWSDPTYESKEFVRSSRGNGVTFGITAANDFARQFRLKHIIRAHQCVQLGVERFAGDLVYTVFSCSNYADAQGNRCGLIFVQTNGHIQMFSLPPLDQIDRSSALLKQLSIGDGVIERISMLSFMHAPIPRTFNLRKKPISKISPIKMSARTPSPSLVKPTGNSILSRPRTNEP